MSRSFDASKLFELRSKIKGAQAAGMEVANSTINDFIVFVLARTAMKFPEVNSTTQENSYTTFDHCNVGVAVDNGQGLFVPVVKDADKKTVAQITADTSSFVSDIRNGKIDAKLFKDGTITISNVGNTGVEMFTPIINQPQSSILGVGAAIDRPKYDKDGNIVLFKSITLSLTFNHATYDGALAAKFLNQLAYDLENIEVLLLG